MTKRALRFMQGWNSRENCHALVNAIMDAEKETSVYMSREDGSRISLAVLHVIEREVLAAFEAGEVNGKNT